MGCTNLVRGLVNHRPSSTIRHAEYLVRRFVVNGVSSSRSGARRLLDVYHHPLRYHSRRIRYSSGGFNILVALDHTERLVQFYGGLLLD